jgi:plasmid stabilization system protein ParE
MRVRWSNEVVAQLNEIVEFLSLSSAGLAQRVATEIYEGAESLVTFPHRGRLGPVPGTREWVIPAHGFILTYEVIGDGIFILAIHHGAQEVPRR